MRTSTATGLFQFLEQTWLGVIKDRRAGARLRPLCQSDHADASGRYEVDDPALRDEIMTAAQGPGRQRRDGRRVHAAERAVAGASASGASRPTANSTSRISSGPMRAAKVIKLAASNPTRQRGRDVSARPRAPTGRSSTTSRAMPAASRASMRRACAPLSGRARRRRCRLRLRLPSRRRLRRRPRAPLRPAGLPTPLA